ncbi:MAG: hypothetical protein PHX54_14400, partial [Lentimicrobiaceae bacterium]|nr:hypothetical protein [Lentimicrobiaceae bacterium]
MKNSLTSYPAWQALEAHYREIKDTTIQTWFNSNKNRGLELMIQDVGIYFDFSKHRIEQKTIDLLIDLGRSANLESHR